MKLLFIVLLTFSIFSNTYAKPSEKLKIDISAECESKLSSNNFKIYDYTRYDISIYSKKLNIDKVDNISFNNGKKIVSIRDEKEAYSYISPYGGNSIKIYWATINQKHNGLKIFNYDQLNFYKDSEQFTVIMPNNKFSKKNIVVYDKSIIDTAFSECDKQIQDSRLILEFERVVVVLFIILILFLILKYLIKSFKRKALEAKEKLEELKKERAEQKVRDIAEDEAIRAKVKKDIDSSSDDELEQLQNLINNAVAKGDSETAKTLLEILNKKKKG